MGKSFNKRVGAWQVYSGHKAKRLHLGYFYEESDARVCDEAGMPMPELGSSIESSKDRRGRPALTDLSNMNGAGI